MCVPTDLPIQLRCIVRTLSGQSIGQVVGQPVGVCGDEHHPLHQRPEH
jgi:hypothetical protein